MLKEQIARDVITWDCFVRQLIGWIVVALVGVDVLHYQIASRVANPERLAFGVKLGKSEIFFILQKTTSTFHSIVSNRNNVTTKAVENSERRRVAMCFNRLCSIFVFQRIELGKPWMCRIHAALIPVATLDRGRIKGRIVGIKRKNLPRRKLNPAVAAIWHFGTHCATCSIVIHDWCDAFFLRLFKFMPD